MISFWGFPKWRSPQITRAMFSMILNVLFWQQTRKCLRHCLRFPYTRTRFASAHILSYAELTLSYADHSSAYAQNPYKGPLPKHEFKGFERGSYKLRSFSIEIYGDLGIPLQSRNHRIQHSWFSKPMFVIGWTNLFTTVLFSVVGLTPHFCTFWLIAYPSGWII